MRTQRNRVASQEGGGIDEHDVGAPPQALDYPAHRAIEAKLVGVFQCGAGRQHFEAARALHPPARVGGSREVLSRTDRLQRVGQPRVPELDIRQPRLLVEAEEPVEMRLDKVRVDDDDPASGACERDGEIGDGRRLPLAVDGARNHDRPGVVVSVGEVEAPAEGTELFRLAPGRVGEHDETVPFSQAGGRRGQASEQAQAESLADGVDGLDSRVERIREKHDDERENETEAECDQAVSNGAGADLRRVVGGLDHLRR